MKSACIVIGSYVNGFSIVQELYENGVRDIFVLDVVKDVAAFSNKISGFYKITNDKESINNVLLSLSNKFEHLILYPNQDVFVEHLNDLYEDVIGFCSIAFNPDNATTYQDKMIQYDFCKKLGVPCPNVTVLESDDDFVRLDHLVLPVILKPTKRDNLKSSVFRVKELLTQEDVDCIKGKLSDYFNEGLSFIASEIIPGDGTQIYAYTGYRNKNGKFLGEWIGKKLSQFPNDYGVFSSASNQAPEILIKQSRTLLEGMNLFGVNEPEYKYDFRDGKYKLMEINLRPMMWHRLGALSGVPLNYIQYLEATNQKVPEFLQNQSKVIHYVYFHHEWINLLMRKGYWKFFKHNLMKGEQLVFALWDRDDVMPFMYSFISIFKRFMRVRKRNK